MHSAAYTGSRCTVFDALLQAAKALLIQPSCPICRASLEGNPAANTDTELQPCGLCLEGYGLAQSITSGNKPLPRKALGTYQGEFRQVVLQIKQQPQSRTGRAVIQRLVNHHPLPQGTLLVPIPS